MRPGAGPIVVAGVALIAVVSWLAVQPGAQRPPRRVITSDRPAVRPAAPPLVRDVLASGVPLSAAQHRALQALATQWEPATATLEHALRAASEEFAHFAKQARAGAAPAWPSCTSARPSCGSSAPSSGRAARRTAPARSPC